MDRTFEPAYRSLSQVTLASSATPSAETVQTLCPWDPVVCSALQLRVARANGDKTKQRRSMAALKQAASTNSVAHCALGQGYSWQEDWTLAREQLERCVQLEPSAQHHYQLAMAYQHLGEKALARQQLNVRATLLGQHTEESVSGRQALQELKH